VLAAHSAFYLGDYDHVRELLSRVGTTVPMPEVTDGLGAIPLLQGYLAASDGNLDASERLLNESVDRLQKENDDSARWIEAFAHNGLGSLKLLRGDAQTAAQEFEASRRMAEDSGNLGAQMQALVFTAGLALLDGRVDEARSLLRDAADLVEQQPYYEGNGYCLEVAASYALGAGEAMGAARALGQASALRELIGARVWALMEQMSELVHSGVRAALGDEGFEAAFVEGRAADPRTSAATVRALVGT
jgi:ATP/maltotriose-dependent transcriptional regulator MalT